jgi:[ribosomal protein S18]-alanine N-acetyltransferase
MNSDHLDAVMEIERYSFPTPWDREMYEYDLSNNVHSRFYIALNELDEVVGYIGNWFILEECHVGTIAVKREWRRQGIAEKLLLHIAQRSVEENITYIILEVRVGNAAAIALYHKLGFTIEGRRKGYYRDTGEDAHLMIHSSPAGLIEMLTSQT